MNKIIELEKLPDTVCSCEQCKRMCSHNRPCWGTPEDIKKIIEAGHADKLMLDWYTDEENEDRHILIIAPAIVGSEEDLAPLMPRGRCALLTKDGLCSLHDRGLKPTEGRKTLCTQPEKEAESIHQHIVTLWDTQAGLDVVTLWRDKVGCDAEPGADNYSMMDYLGMLCKLYEDNK